MQSVSEPAFRIVLAEDNPADVMLVRMALKQAAICCELIVLEDGEQAMRFIESLDAEAVASIDRVDVNPPSMDLPAMDLLLLDLHLPRLDGRDILRRLRSSRNHAATPVVVLSASDDPRHFDEVRGYPRTRHFRKPPSFADYMELGSVIRAALS